MHDFFLTSSRFPFDSLQAIIGGRSAIDLPRLRLHSLEEAHQFLRIYGFNLEVGRHRLEVELLRAEAVSFLKEELLAGVNELWLPEEVELQRDVRQLLLWASAPNRCTRQLWSCALLRVMHTLAHAQSYFELHFGTEVREQILSSFRPHVQQNASGAYFLGEGEGAIPLASFEVKPGKPLRSVAIKLLHKVENVASSVFDHVGVRFVTFERFDALLVVRYLRKNNVLMFANAIPSRSRNTLIDMDLVRQHLQEVDARCERGELSDDGRWQAMRDAVRNDPYPAGETVKNAHSSFAYHSIQFTCRQQVRVPHPYAADSAALLHRLQAEGLSNWAEAQMLKRRMEEDCEVHFFFPFEVQILDVQSYETSRSGQASHAEYKRRQFDTVRHRVLGALMT